MSELMNYEKSARFSHREKLALRYADAIMYDPAQADDALWAALHEEFSESELVELGYWIGFTFGGQRWLKTLSTAQGEFAASLEARKAGLANAPTSDANA
jgi:alkylhydroperoxidase family enzyme